MSENEEGPSLIGQHGGRYPRGAIGDVVERDLAADVITAIRRKASKIRNGRYSGEVDHFELAIYANSNPALLANPDRAFGLLTSVLKEYWHQLIRGSKIEQIFVILQDRLFVFSGVNSKCAPVIEEIKPKLN